jgi:hypothetical protein
MQSNRGRCRNFAAIWGFTIPRFHPNLASLFLQELVMTIYIDRRPSLVGAILGNHTRLGSHSDIIVYTRNKLVYEYRWGHESVRPFGVSLPMGCPDCGRLRTWKPATSVGLTIPASASVQCGGKTKVSDGDKRRNCSGTIALQLSGTHRVTKRGTGATGEWYGKYLGGSNARHPLWWSYKEGILSADVGRSDYT